MKNNYVIVIVFLSMFFLTTQRRFAQVLERNQTSSGNTSSFSYSITSSYGATTSANATPNLSVDTEAILNLKEDSIITNKAGEIGGNTGAVITTTPTSTNVNLTGIEANNEFILDDGTSFRAALQSSEIDGNQSNGTASASAFHTLTLTLTNTNSSFINTIISNFEGDE